MIAQDLKWKRGVLPSDYAASADCPKCGAVGSVMMLFFPVVAKMGLIPSTIECTKCGEQYDKQEANDSRDR